MAEKIAVESGNPYRDNKGRLATSPNKALDASFAALKGKTFVPKGKGGNKDVINAKKKEAEQKLAALRGGPKEQASPAKSKELTDSEELYDAVIGYQADSSGVNMMLRDAQGDDSKIPEDDRLLIAQLDVQMKDEIKEDTLYRGLFADLGAIKEGDIIESHAYASTSKDPVVGEYGSDPDSEFVEGEKEGKTSYVMNISIPKGSKGLDFENLDLDEGEEEVLLPRGTKFKITKIGEPVNADNAVGDEYMYTPLEVEAIFPPEKSGGELESWVSGGDGTATDSKYKNFDIDSLYNNLPDSYARTLDTEQKVGDKKLSEYYHDQKNQAGTLVDMSPDDYLQALVDYSEKKQTYKVSYDSIEAIKSRTNMDNVAQYAEDMRKGDVFDMPSLVFGDDGYLEDQEGIHRTFAAKEAGLSNIPVYIRYAPTKPPVDFYKKHGDAIIRGYDGRDDSWKDGETDAPEDNAPEKVEEQNSFGMGIRKAVNANITPDQQRQIDLATEQFKQAVKRVDSQVLARYIQAVQDGDYAQAEAILAQAQEAPQVNTLFFALLTIGAILLPLYAKQRLVALFTQFGMRTVFAETRTGKESMRKQADRGAKSHIRTISKDIFNALNDAIADEITTPSVEASLKDEYEELIPLEGKKLKNKVVSDKEIFKFAAALVLAGDSKRTIIQKLQTEFEGLGNRRATLIAGNEANRVFTMSQFDADQQFLAQNQLTQKAYKRLVSNTGHPEAICKSIIDKTAKNPIPFTQDFVPFGKTITVTDNGKTYKFTANYEKLQSGHIHVNCHCRYELLIKQDDGTFFNTYDMKVLNDLDFDEKKHKRDKDGKFAKKRGISNDIDLSSIDNVNDFNTMVENAYWEGSLGQHNEATTEAVRAYQGHFYDAINIHARAGMLDDELTVYGDDTTYGEVIKRIGNAADLKLTSNVLVYRGTEIPHHQLVEVGEYMDAKSFLSTSVDQKVAETFKYKGGSMFVITAKKGQKVIIPDYVTFGKRGRTMNEAEVLMPTGSSLKITKIDGDIVYAELN